jgi:Flp pilus assembly protein TadD
MTIQFKHLLLSAALICSLPACQATQWRELNTGDPVRIESTKENLRALARQTAYQSKFGQEESIPLMAAENAYIAAPDDSDAALHYATLLRKQGLFEQADLILKPFTDNLFVARDDVLIEYAKLKIETGHFDEAQIMAQEAGFKAQSAETLMILGVALDAQGHHEVAAKQFRAALNEAGMDFEMKNKILNNLALSLLAQGKQTEAMRTIDTVDSVAGVDMAVIEANKQLIKNL